MSGDMKTMCSQSKVPDSAQLAAMIGSTDFSSCAATVVGYGNMGKEYVKALRMLKVGNIHVCSRSAGPLEELQDVPGIETISGGFEQLEYHPATDELGIIATSPELLVAAAEHLATLGFSRLLIEKPVSLWPGKIEQLAATIKAHGVEAACAFNRLAYPSFHEVQARVIEEGGITSCTYAFTEMIKPDWFEVFPAEELARWGIANSLHVVGMAHGLISPPISWSGYTSGSLPWHHSGAVFVGSGLSEKGVPFSYQADWGSTGRWGVEVHTSESSYRLCPLEQVFRRTTAFGDWESVQFTTLAPEVKVGFVEQVAYNLGISEELPKMSLSLIETAKLTRYGEQIFGY